MGRRSGLRAPTTVNWALHNLDLSGTRYSPLDQINTSNVKSLVAEMVVSARCHRWRQQSDHSGDGRRHHRTSPMRAAASTPLMRQTVICSGRTTSPSFSAAAPKPATYSGTVASATPNGVVYIGAGSFLFALDAKSGKPFRRLATTARPASFSTSSRCAFPR